MKKYFILLLFISVKSFAQDTTKVWHSYPSITSVSSSDKFMVSVAGLTKTIEYQYLNRLSYSSPWMYPNSSEINYAIGISSTPSVTGYKFYVKGNSYFEGLLRISNRIEFANGASIRQSGNNLAFIDPEYGRPITLSQIAALGASSNVALNLLTKRTSGTINTYVLGGDASESTSLLLGAYPFQITTTSGGIFKMDGSDMFLYSPNMYINPTRSFTLQRGSYYIKADTSYRTLYADNWFNMSLTSMELRSAVDRPFYIGSSGGIGRVYVSSLGYTQYEPQGAPSYQLGRIYLNYTDSLLYIGRRGTYEQIGTGAGGGGDVNLQGTLSSNAIVKGYNGTTIQTSSAEIVGDTLKANYIKIPEWASEGDTMAVIVLPGTGGLLKLIHIVDTSAAFGLTMAIETANKILSDQRNGEIGWYYYNKKEQRIEKRYGLGGYQHQINQQLMAGIEINLRLIADLENRVKELEAKTEKRKLFKRKK